MKRRKAPTNTRSALDRLLAARNEHPERLPAIDRQIYRIFGRVRAVMVLDMCGFSRLTVRYGITHFLAMIHRLHRAVTPLVASGGGQIVKTEADNVFAVFKDVRPALATARAIQAQLRTANLVLPQDWDLHVAAGIGYGEFLMVGDHDIFGSEMNLASKLGEDVAERGDIYLTEAAYDRLGKRPGFERKEIHLSSMTLTAYRAR